MSQRWFESRVIFRGWIGRPMVLAVSDYTTIRAIAITTRGQSFSGNVQRTSRTAVAGYACRRRTGGSRRCGGGRGGCWWTGHPAGTTRCGGTLRSRWWTFFVEASVHHGPPGHPGGGARGGGWWRPGRMNHMVVQGGCGARHGIRDGGNDGVDERSRRLKNGEDLWKKVEKPTD